MCNFNQYLTRVISPALLEYCPIIFLTSRWTTPEVTEAPQAALLVHLTIRKAAAFLHGGRQHKSCCEAQKKGTRV